MIGVLVHVLNQATPAQHGNHVKAGLALQTLLNTSEDDGARGVQVPVSMLDRGKTI